MKRSEIYFFLLFAYNLCQIGYSPTIPYMSVAVSQFLPVYNVSDKSQKCLNKYKNVTIKS